MTTAISTPYRPSQYSAPSPSRRQSLALAIISTCALNSPNIFLDAAHKQHL
jgi:hypothetical protein